MQRGSVLLLLLMIILIVVIGVVGVFYYQFISKSPVAQPNFSNVTPSQTPGKREVFDELLGLKFNLPKTFSLKKEIEEEYFKRAFGNIRKNFSTYVLYPPAEFAEAFYIVPARENNLDNAILTVWTFKNPDNLDAKMFYDRYWYYPFVWGDFTSAKNKIAPESVELINVKEGSYGVVDYRDGKPRFIYLPLRDKELMLQIQLPTEGNETGKEILKSFIFD